MIFVATTSSGKANRPSVRLESSTSALIGHIMPHEGISPMQETPTLDIPNLSCSQRNKTLFGSCFPICTPVAGT